MRGKRAVIGRRGWRVIAVCFFFAALNACASFLQDSATESTPSGSSPSERSAASPASATSVKKNTDIERLARLWRERQQERTLNDYPVGPGDVIEISVPAIEELRARTVRVSADGTIALPFVGKMEVVGLTEEQLRDKITKALLKYMYDPRVVTFVREYHSRQVAVLGAVFKPGMYSLNAGSETVLDMISQAGGIASGADPHLYLIPAEYAKDPQVKEITAALPQSILSQDPAPLILKRTEPILIDLKELALGGMQHYLSLAVRPGDVIMVPGGGQVLVEGWVEKPGAYGVTPGLTVSGIVIAAGGLLYPADTTAVKVIRSEKNGKKSSLTADLQKIKNGESPDITLQGGDIVEVSPVTSKLIPYGLYRFFTAIVSIGVGGTVPIAGS